jgi:hypothetical protein
MHRTTRTVALLVVLAAGAASISLSQTSVPFAPGEKLQYEVKLGALGTVGKGSMEVLGIEPQQGHPTYHLRMAIKGGVLFAKVDDRLESWMDTQTLATRRIDHRQKEVNFKRNRTIDLYPEQRRWQQVQGNASGELATDLPLDEVAFLYYVRTLDLEVGKTYTFDRYYKASGNPVVLKVLRVETVTVPAGRFETIVVQPTFRTDGLFGQGGEAELYFSADDRRLLVKMRSKVPVVGSLRLELASYTPGQPLAPVSQELSGDNDLTRVVGVVVRDEQDLAQVGPALPVRDRRREIAPRIADELEQGFEIGS